MNTKAITVSIVLVLLAGVAGVQVFGTRVKEKFHHANASVVSEVRFGDEGHVRTPRWSRPPAVFAEAPADEKFAFPTAANASPAIPVGLDRFSTFALDVDTGSYSYARRYLAEYGRPEPSSVRLEEFVNAMDYETENLASDGVLGVAMEASPSPWNEGQNTRLLRVTLRAEALKVRPPLHLTFLVDTSGSMMGEDRLPLAQQAIMTAAESMKGSDTISIVTYSGSVEVALAPTSAERLHEIQVAVDGLVASGGTAMGSGMELAYRQAMESHRPGDASRVVVLSDGDANIGATHAGDILRSIRSYVDEGITMSTVGFGLGNYQDAMMERLANSGDGNYQYIATRDDVQKAFGAELDQMAFVAAEEVKAQLEFNPNVVESWRQLGYENRQLADADFRNDHVDAGEVGPGHTVTALYEVTLKGGLLDRLAERREGFATMRLRYQIPGERRTREVGYRLEEENSRSTVAEASRDHRTAIAAALLADVLRFQLSEDYLALAASYAETGNASARELRRMIDDVRRKSS